MEFVKIATSLMMARIMSSYSFNIGRFTDLAKVAAVILLPLIIIVLQNDTGSGLVLGAFLFVISPDIDRSAELFLKGVTPSLHKCSH